MSTVYKTNLRRRAQTCGGRGRDRCQSMPVPEIVSFAEAAHMATFADDERRPALQVLTVATRTAGNPVCIPSSIMSIYGTITYT